MKIMALKPFRYAGRPRLRGEAFEASDRDAKLLKRVGRATDHIEPEPLQAPTVAPEPPAPSAVEPLPQPVEENTPRVARHYRRRDMTAEEE